MVSRVTCVALQAALAAEMTVARDDRCGRWRENVGGKSSRREGGGEKVGNCRGLGERGSGGGRRRRGGRSVGGIVCLVGELQQLKTLCV